MAQRVRYTDPTTGRFVSASAVGGMESAIRSVYDAGELVSQQVLTFGQVQDETVGELQNWYQEDSRWGARWYADEEPLDLFGLSQTAFPDGFDSFRVTYHVADNPDYPRRYASPEWMGADRWPPDLGLLRGVSATGIAHIVFRNK